MTEAVLTIDVLAYWHCGTGRGQSAVLDALTARDELGLPIVPGRTVKGLLRDAVRRYAALGHCRADWTTRLFGSSGFAPPTGAQEAPTPQSRTEPGRLSTTSAFVDDGVRRWFREAARTTDPAILARRRATLFRTLSATAIDPDSGVARTGSLRAVEVAVPLTLRADLTVAGADPAASGADSETWQGVLTGAVGLIGAVGGHRTRGLGRCTVSLVLAEGGRR